MYDVRKMCKCANKLYTKDEGVEDQDVVWYHLAKCVLRLLLAGQGLRGQGDEHQGAYTIEEESDKREGKGRRAVWGTNLNAMH